MATLLNRVPTGRLICLHSLLKYLADRFGKGNFTLREAQFDAKADKSIHDHCPLLVKVRASRSPVCPFLKNPLNPAKCELTQSLQRDTQKLKSVGDAVNALEALGFVDRHEGKFSVNNVGLRIAQLDYFAREYLEELRKQAKGYGLFLGFLFLARNLSHNNVVRRDALKEVLGFPETGDFLTQKTLFGKETIRVSTGCTADTRSRTTSLLLKWGLTLGYLSLTRSLKLIEDVNVHVATLDTIKKRILAKEITTKIPESVFKGTYVPRPIEYSFLNPDPRARRDLSKKEREASMKMDEKVKNRRLAIINALSSAFKRNKSLDYSEFKDELKGRNNFVIDAENYDNAMNLELKTVVLAGALWEAVESGTEMILKPISHVDESVLRRNVPKRVLQELDEVLSVSSIYV